VANKLIKGFLGTNNFDANSRLCMASAVTGYKNSLGSDGPPVADADIELADCFFIIGSNTAECHPIVYRRIKRRKEQAPEDVKVIVVDPRRTETADIADSHLPIRPGADIALWNSPRDVASWWRRRESRRGSPRELALSRFTGAAARAFTSVPIISPWTPSIPSPRNRS
jgi:ferredoxin-nitrate reductase